MDDLAYYNTGCDPEPGLARYKLFVRRQFRKILLPGSKRLAQILTALCQRMEEDEATVRELSTRYEELAHRHHDLAAKYPAMVAFGWDYVALTRRLTALEDHVNTLLAEREQASADRDPSGVVGRPGLVSCESAA